MSIVLQRSHMEAILIMNGWVPYGVISHHWIGLVQLEESEIHTPKINERTAVMFNMPGYAVKREGGPMNYMYHGPASFFNWDNGTIPWSVIKDKHVKRFYDYIIKEGL